MTLLTKNFGKLIAGLAMLLVSACAFHNQYQDVAAGEPSSTVSSHGARIFSINGQPTSFWKTGEVFVIPPGRVTLEVVAADEPYNYEPVVFSAVKGMRYHLAATEDRSFVSLMNVTYENGPRTLCVAKRLRE